MSLDFFASDHQKNIGQDTSCFVMDEKMHKDIFLLSRKIIVNTGLFLSLKIITLILLFYLVRLVPYWMS